jgi:hypothetical protein
MVNINDGRQFGAGRLACCERRPIDESLDSKQSVRDTKAECTGTAQRGSYNGISGLCDAGWSPGANSPVIHTPWSNS